MLVIYILVTYSLSDLNQGLEQSETLQCFAGFNQWFVDGKAGKQEYYFQIYPTSATQESQGALKSFINAAI